MKVNALSFAKMMALLRDQAVTRVQITDMIGVHKMTVSHYTKYLKRERLIFIQEWRPDSYGRLVVPAFRMGDRPDAPRPVGISSTERGRRYRARLRERERDPEQERIGIRTRSPLKRSTTEMAKSDILTITWSAQDAQA